MLSYKKLLAGVLLLAILAAVIASCTPSPSASLNSAGQPATAEPDWMDQPVMPFDSQVVAEGKVVPIEYVTLSFSSVGIVDEVLIKQDQPVEAGAVIARLKGAETLKADVVSAEVALFNAKQEKEDLYDKAAYDKVEAELKVVEAEKALEKAQKARNSKNYKRGSDYQIDVARADYKVLEEQYKMARDAFDMLKDRPTDDYDRSNALIKMNEAKAKMDGALNTVNTLTGLPGPLEIAEADAKLHFAEVDLAKAKKDLEELQTGPKSDDIAAVDMKIMDAEAKLEAAKASLADVELVSPISGTIVKSSIQVGQLVGPDTDSVIVADLGKLRIETTDLSELSVVRVKVDQKTEITFDAIPDLKLTGKVTGISSMGEDRRGDMIYTVYIQLDKTDPRLLWNMTSTVSFSE